MYSNVVLEVEHHNFEEILEVYKDQKGYQQDTDLSADDWRKIVASYKEAVERETGNPSRRTRANSSGAPSARCSPPG